MNDVQIVVSVKTFIQILIGVNLDRPVEEYLCNECGIYFLPKQ
jgi:hypothetical protein